MTVTGTFHAATGVVGRSTNMPWLDGTAPAGALADLVGIPGVAVRDGAATATAEAQLGAGRGAEDENGRAWCREDETLWVFVVSAIGEYSVTATGDDIRL